MNMRWYAIALWLLVNVAGADGAAAQLTVTDPAPSPQAAAVDPCPVLAMQFATDASAMPDVDLAKLRTCITQELTRRTSGALRTVPQEHRPVPPIMPIRPRRNGPLPPILPVNPQ